MNMVSLGWKLMKEKIHWISIDLTIVHTFSLRKWSSLLGWIMWWNPPWSWVAEIWKNGDFHHQPPSHRRNHSSFDFKSRDAPKNKSKSHDHQGTFVWKTPATLITPWSYYSLDTIDICCSHGVDTGVIETLIHNLLSIDQSWCVKMSWLRHDDMMFLFNNLFML